MAFSDVSRSARITGWFLFVSYFVGGPAFAIAEFHGQLTSERFGYSSEFVYLICLTQFICAVALLWERIAPWSIAVLTGISLGAIASHAKIDSPLTGLPALAYTVLQIWLVLQFFRRSPVNGAKA